MTLLGLDFDNTLVRYDKLFHKIALEKGLIPFYSIYGEKRRRALERQVKRFNEKNTYQYKILSGMYFTCPGPINEKEQCRQNISILDTPDNIVFDLPRLQPQQNMK